MRTDTKQSLAFVILLVAVCLCSIIGTLHSESITGNFTRSVQQLRREVLLMRDYQDGFEAGRAGRPESDNPHNATDRLTEWSNGWRASRPIASKK